MFPMGVVRKYVPGLCIPQSSCGRPHLAKMVNRLIAQQRPDFCGARFRSTGMMHADGNTEGPSLALALRMRCTGGLL